MHHFDTPGQVETTVQHPKKGEMLVGSNIERWQTFEANTTEQIKVLTQKNAEFPQWVQLAELPSNSFIEQQPAIADPIASSHGLQAIDEIQSILLQIIRVLRLSQLIKS